MKLNNFRDIWVPCFANYAQIIRGVWSVCNVEVAKFESLLKYFEIENNKNASSISTYFIHFWSSKFISWSEGIKKLNFGPSEDRYTWVNVRGSMIKRRSGLMSMIEFKEKIWKECKKVQCMYLETSWLFWQRISYLHLAHWKMKPILSLDSRIFELKNHFENFALDVAWV